MNLSWNLKNLYPSIESTEYKNDILKLENSINSLSSAIESISSDDLLYVQTQLENYSKAFELFNSLRVYIVANLALDTANAQAKVEESKVLKYGSNLNQIYLELLYFVTSLNQKQWDNLFSTTAMKVYEFSFLNFRNRLKYMLPKEKEKLLSQMNQFGPQAFSNLYEELSGKARLKIPSLKDKQLSKAETLNLLFHSNPELRKEAWIAIQNSMQENEEAYAAILNGIYGWRTQVNEERSKFKDSHILNETLFQAKIKKETLFAMMNAIESQKDWLQNIGKTMGQVLNKGAMNPWDLLAPAPIKTTSELSVQQALELISKSFEKWTSEFKPFLNEMIESGAIDSQVTSTRRGGAFQMYFAKKKQSLVFLTFEGSYGNVSTLAHELGHAFHSYLQKDLNIMEIDNPMTLAETASVFAQFCLNEYLLESTSDENTKKMALWELASDAFSFLINIPARFDFEVEAYNKRSKSYLPANELKNITVKSWEKWYGSSLTEYDLYYWAHKLHFSLYRTEFYNYPYTFGYLFSLCLFSELKKQGPVFFETYKEILRNTGRMTAEDLVKKYLDKDITQESFWLSGLEIVKERIRDFEKMFLSK